MAHAHGPPPVIDRAVTRYDPGDAGGFKHANIRAVNFLDQTPRFVIGRNPTRTGITFHNPGTEVAVVFPELVLVYDGRGHNDKLIPTSQQLGGGFVLNPAATLFFTDPACRQAWQALTLSGLCQPLTIMEQG